MNLPIANVIRSLRREWNITQEELAAAIGVTYQSVSRWENGQAYPVPKIAKYFDISTDVLFGTDRESIDKKLDAHYQKIGEVQNNPEDFYQTCKSAYEDFPDEFRFGLWLCRCYIDFHVRPFEKHLDEIRKICRNIIENCTDEDYRMEAFRAIIIAEEENQLEIWLNMLPNWKSSRDVLFENRYDYRNDVEKCNIQRQKNFILFLGYVFYNCIGKNNPEKTVIGYRMVLKLIDIMREPSAETDAWMKIRADFHLRIAAGCFENGQKEEGYTELEKAIELYVKYAELPINARLSYRCPTLNLLTENKQSEPEDDTNDNGEYICWWAYHDLTNPAGIFKCVHDEERYKIQIERLLPYLPMRDRQENCVE